MVFGELMMEPMLSDVNMKTDGEAVSPMLAEL